MPHASRSADDRGRQEVGTDARPQAERVTTEMNNATVIGPTYPIFQVSPDVSSFPMSAGPRSEIARCSWPSRISS